MNHVLVETSVEDCRWDNFAGITPQRIKTILKRIIKNYRKIRGIEKIELSILLTNDSRIRLLNAKFRKKHSTTNVISFPDIEISYKEIESYSFDQKFLYLGDIAFCYDVILYESEQMNKSFQAHFEHLLVHSILHLIGYRHDFEEDALIMESVENAILCVI